MTKKILNFQGSQIQCKSHNDTFTYYLRILLLQCQNQVVATESV